MVSKSQRTETRRKIKKRKMGGDRKRKLRSKGSTPGFSIEPPG